MKKAVLSVLIVFLILACDPNRLYETNHDFNDRYWLMSEQPVFEFKVEDTDKQYNVYANIRNTISYPHANLYFTYYLTDSTGKELENGLRSEFLFDKKTGEPFGDSGLGDIYDHQFPLLKDYSFKFPGKYIVRLQQFMRRDTLEGILSVGVRVERNEPVN